MGAFLLLVGILANFACGVWIIVLAFRVSVGWGLAVIFLPFASLVFIFNNWKECKAPFLGSLASAVILLMGVFLVPSPDDSESEAQTRVASRSSRSSNDDSTSSENQQRANYSSAAAPYEPPRSAYQPPAYVPSYNPPQETPATATTDTQAVEDEWTRKPAFEQVYVDRKTNEYYSEKCKKKPENGYRIPKSVALMQGMVEAKCR